LNIAEISNLVRPLVGEELDGVHLLLGGGNAASYKVITKTGESYFCKKYAKSDANRANRLVTEWEALLFLRQNRIDCVPAPVSYDEENQFSIFQWIDGRNVNLRESPDEKIQQALDFLQKINLFKGAASHVSVASEAAFSLREIIGIIEGRLNRLLALESFDSVSKGMRAFLLDDLLPALTLFKEKAFKQYDILNIAPSKELALAERILSPSDFGFHNCLEVENTLFWLDFEYFGWDDPAKTTIDFVLHPGMSLSLHQKKIFWDGMSKFLNDDYRRIKALYPIFGIKWCIILLNEFLVNGMQRRRDSGKHASGWADIRFSQLQQAKSLLNQLFSHHSEFPYE